ncbi:MAG: mechanosensitive ion channel family protein [Myxococcota bacterium]
MDDWWLIRTAEQLLQRKWQGNPVLDWALALAVFLVGAVVLRLLGGLVIRRLERVASHTSTDVDDAFVYALQRTRWFFWAALSLLLALIPLDLPAPVVGTIRTIVVVVALFQAGFWASGLIRYQTRRYVRSRGETHPGSLTGVNMVSLAVRVVAWAILLLVALANMGVNITALIAGLGVGGIAIALAVQSILGDLFASVSILLDKPFVVGEFIIVGEFLGTVEKVGVKTTHIRSLNGELLVFSNADLLQSRIRNYARMAERRSLFHFAIPYGTDHDKVARVPGMVREIVEEIDGTRFDRTHLKEFGDYALVFEAVYFLLDPDYAHYMDVQQRVNLEILRRFQAEGIRMAWPAREIVLHQAAPAEAQ